MPLLLGPKVGAQENTGQRQLPRRHQDLDNQHQGGEGRKPKHLQRFTLASRVNQVGHTFVQEPLWHQWFRVSFEVVLIVEGAQLILTDQTPGLRIGRRPQIVSARQFVLELHCREQWSVIATSRKLGVDVEQGVSGSEGILHCQLVLLGAQMRSND